MAEWIVLKNQMESHIESEAVKNAKAKTGGKPKPEAPAIEGNQGRKILGKVAVEARRRVWL